MGASVSAMRDFAIESTLADRSYLPLIRQWRNLRYRVKIVYLWLDCVDLAIERLRLRVAQGGHHVPEDFIRRRFRRSWQNFEHLYRPLADLWQVYNCCEALPELIEEGERK